MVSWPVGWQSGRGQRDSGAGAWLRAARSLVPATPAEEQKLRPSDAVRAWFVCPMYPRPGVPGRSPILLCCGSSGLPADRP